MGHRAVYENVSIPEAAALKLRAVSKATRVPKTQILRQLLDEHLDDWHRRFCAGTGDKGLPVFFDQQTILDRWVHKAALRIHSVFGPN